MGREKRRRTATAMSTSVDTSLLVPKDRLTTAQDAESRRIFRMMGRAEEYLCSFGWHVPISDCFFGCGVGDVIAVFLFRFAKQINGSDSELWVVEGDAPSAYFVTDRAPTPALALQVYCGLMEEWVTAVLAGQPLDDVFPVATEATVENAQRLLVRIRYIRAEIFTNLRRAEGG
jgi:hypothetical protein